jgi:putative AdoMet-dependent methyltransferase
MLSGAKSGMSVIDLGIGTGNLAARFTALACKLWCTDFSSAMLNIIRQKLPDSHVEFQDLRENWPTVLDRSFDRIVLAYVFHHFELDLKASILVNLIPHLAPNGKIIIGEIAFHDAASLEKVKNDIGIDWEDEYYLLAEETIPVIEKLGFKVEYTQVSICAGIFTLES